MPIVAHWDGDRLTLDMPTQALAMARAARRRTVRHPAGEDPHPQPVPRRRLRLEGLHGRPADPRHHGGKARRQAGQARAAPRADVRPGRPSRADAAAPAPRRRRRGQADRARPPRAHRVEHASTISSSRPPTPRTRSMPARRSATTHDAVRVDTGTPLFMRAPGEATGIDRAGERDRRDGLGLRHRSAGVPPEELCRGRADHRQAVLLQGAARMLRAGRRALRLGRSARSQPRQMRDEAGLLVGWGMGTATFPALMFQAEARATIRARRHRRWSRPARTTWARAPGRRSPRSPPTGSALDIDRIEFRSGHSDLPDAGIAGGSGAYRDRRQRDPQRRRGRHRQARRARHQRPSARRCSAPAMPA